MRPEILPRLTILLTIVSTFSLPLSLSFALLLAFSPSLFRYQLFVFPLYIHCTQRSYHLKPNLDPKARREEIPAGISLVSPSIPPSPPSRFLIPCPFSLLHKELELSWREINASINQRGKRHAFSSPFKLNIQRIRKRMCILIARSICSRVFVHIPLGWEYSPPPSPYTKYLSEVVQGMYLIFNGAMLLLNGRFYTALRRASFYSSTPTPG